MKQWDKIENPYIDSIYNRLIFRQRCQSNSRRQIAFSTNGARTSGYTYTNNEP